MKSKYHAALVIVRLVSTALESRPLRIETLLCKAQSAETVHSRRDCAWNAESLR